MQNLSSELSTIKRQLEDCHEIREERNALAERLRSSEEGRMSLTEQLQQAEAKLGSLSTQVKEKEILRTENESLKQSLRGLAEKAGEVNDLKKKLQASEGIIMNNDEMVSFRLSCAQRHYNAFRMVLTACRFSLQLRNMELELEEARTELSKCAVREIEQARQLQETISAHEKLQSDYKRLEIAWNAKTDMAKNDETLETTPGKSAKFEREKESGISIVSDGTEKKLQEEVKRLQNEKTALTAQLRTVKTTHENHLIEVATNREKIRELEGLLEDSRNRAAELEAMVGKDSMIPEGPARSQRKRQRNENSH
jgi:DNA repair exonuclease SbcCD ATPase subunit